MSNVLVISDLQVPFDRSDAIPFLKAVAKKHKIDRIIQIGDLVDEYSFSSYDHDPDAMSPGDEVKAAIWRLKQYYKAFPKVDVIYGNHDIRIYRKALQAGIPKNFIRGLSDILQFPKGWKFHDELTIDGVIYEHGDKLGNGSGVNAFKKAVDNNMASTVYGHFHAQAGIKYYANKKHLCFAMNVGCLMDTTTYAAAYGHAFVSKPIISCAVVLNGVPTIIPMTLDKYGMWTGKL